MESPFISKETPQINTHLALNAIEEGSAMSSDSDDELSEEEIGVNARKQRRK
jgi:hypothetical protein